MTTTTKVKGDPKPRTKQTEFVEQEDPTGPIPPTLGGKLMELIESKGLSISAAAEKAGMTRQQLWRVIQGDVPNPGILTVQTAVRALGGKMKDLFADGDLVPGGLRNHAENE